MAPHLETHWGKQGSLLLSPIPAFWPKRTKEVEINGRELYSSSCPRLVRFIGQEMFQRREKKRVELSLPRADTREIVPRQKLREEFLGQILGGERIVTGAAHLV